MLVRISVNKADAFKAGINKHGEFNVEIDPATLTQDQRDFIVQFPSTDNICQFNLCKLNQMNNTDMSAEAVVKIVDAHIAQRKKEAWDEVERREARVQEWLAADIEKCIIESFGLPRLRDRGDSSIYNIPTDTRLDARCEEARLLAKQRAEVVTAKHEAEKLRNREEAAAKRLQEENDLAILKAWSLEHGSVLLIKRIDGEYEWEGLARQEWCNSIQSDEWEDLDNDSPFDVDPDVEDRTTPTQEEIEALERFKEHLLDRGVASLKHLTYECEDEGYEPRKETRTEIKVVFDCPTKKMIRWYAAK